MSRVTEKRNIASKGIDERPIREILEIINKEDQKYLRQSTLNYHRLRQPSRKL